MLAKALVVLLIALPPSCATITRQQKEAQPVGDGTDGTVAMEVESNGKVIKAHREEEGAPYHGTSGGVDALAHMGRPKEANRVTDDQVTHTKSADLWQRALDGDVLTKSKDKRGVSTDKTVARKGTPTTLTTSTTMVTGNGVEPQTECKKMMDCFHREFGHDGSGLWNKCFIKWGPPDGISCINPDDRDSVIAECPIDKCMPKEHTQEELEALCPCGIVCESWQQWNHANENVEIIPGLPTGGRVNGRCPGWLAEKRNMQQGSPNSSLSERREAGAADWVAGAARTLDTSAVEKCT